MERNENITPYDKIKEDEMYHSKTGEYLSTVHSKTRETKELSEKDLKEAKYCATRFCEIVSAYNFRNSAYNLRQNDFREKCPIDEKMFTMIYDGIKNGDRNVINNAIVLLNTIKTKCEKEVDTHDFQYGEKFYCYSKNYDDIAFSAEGAIENIIIFRDEYKDKYENKLENYEAREIREARNKYPNLSFLLKGFETEIFGNGDIDKKWDINNPETREILDACELRLEYFRKYLECYVKLSEIDKVSLKMLMEMDEYKEIDFSKLFNYAYHEFEYDDEEDYERHKLNELRGAFLSDFIKTTVPFYDFHYSDNCNRLRRKYDGYFYLGNDNSIVNIENCLIYHGYIYYGYMENQPLYENPLKDEATKKTIEWTLGEINDEQFIENIDRLIKLNCEKSEMITIGKDKTKAKEKGEER